jgi:hypothetical protein
MIQSNRNSGADEPRKSSTPKYIVAAAAPMKKTNQKTALSITPHRWSSQSFSAGRKGSDFGAKGGKSGAGIQKPGVRSQDSRTSVRQLF